MKTDDIQSKIRGQINRYIFDNGFAPTVKQLLTFLQLDEQQVQEGLTALVYNHTLVLHPNSFDIWVAHPFALFPTLYWVKTTDKQWWGNSTWCSLGIAIVLFFLYCTPFLLKKTTSFCK